MARASVVGRSSNRSIGNKKVDRGKNKMKLWHRVVSVLACVAGLASGATALAADAARAPVAQEPSKDIVLKGDAKCTRCHDESDAPAVLAIGKTRHGTNADGRTPTCTSCHGESDAHVNNQGGKERPKPERMFTKDTKSTVEARNGACLSCHEKDAKRSHWAGSIHQIRDVACTSCHQIHTAHDKVCLLYTSPSPRDGLLSRMPS